MGTTVVRLDENCESFGKDNGLIHEAVVTGRKVRAGQNFWAKLAHDEELFKKVVGFVAGNGVIAQVPAMIMNYKPTPSQIRAREIMGKNYLGIEEVVRHFATAYTEEQFSALAEVPFPEAVLGNCKDTHLLVAGFPMSLAEIRGKAPIQKPRTFAHYENAYYNKFAFLYREKVQVRWYLIRKETVPNSTWMRFGDQARLVHEYHEEVLKACELAYGVVLCFMETGERLFPKMEVRTDSVTLSACAASIGPFTLDGLEINSYYNADCRANLGVAAAREIER